jgi:hypothetical protein
MMPKTSWPQRVASDARPVVEAAAVDAIEFLPRFFLFIIVRAADILTS